jgi:hypothetical protein
MRKYDLVMTHKLDADDFFIHRVQQHCAERGLNFFLIEPIWVETFYEKLLQGTVDARVVLNMHSEHHQPDDIYHRLVHLAHRRGARIIDPPDIALAAFSKALIHPRLEQAGLKLPFTIIVSRAEAESLHLDERQCQRLGTPFVIKPSLGYGKRGVLLDATSPADLRRSIAHWPDDHYLVQEKIVPRIIDGWPAYFRIFYAFGSVWLCWWNCYTDRYRSIKPGEIEPSSLDMLNEIACRLASISNMRFFSSEVALTNSGEFILIDYVNDQCHMLTQSANPAIGVPDEIVASIARKLVDGAQQLMGS